MSKNEFDLTIDFIKKHDCDIIAKDLNEIELKNPVYKLINDLKKTIAELNNM